MEAWVDLVFISVFLEVKILCAGSLLCLDLHRLQLSSTFQACAPGIERSCCLVTYSSNQPVVRLCAKCRSRIFIRCQRTEKRQCYWSRLWFDLNACLAQLPPFLSDATFLLDINQTREKVKHTPLVCRPVTCHPTDVPNPPCTDVPPRHRIEHMGSLEKSKHQTNHLHSSSGTKQPTIRK